MLIERDINILTAVFHCLRARLCFSSMTLRFGLFAAIRPVFNEHYNLLILLRHTDNLCELSIMNEPSRTLSTGGFREGGMGF